MFMIIMQLGKIKFHFDAWSKNYKVIDTHIHMK